MNNSNRSKIDVDVFSLIVGVCTLLEFFVCMCVYKGWKATLIILKESAGTLHRGLTSYATNLFFRDY